MVYRVLDSHNRNVFEGKVNVGLSKGWKLVGGVFLNVNGYSQAMVIDDNDDGDGDK